MENRWNIQEAPSCLKVDQQSSSPWPLSVGQPRLLVWPSFFFLFFLCLHSYLSLFLFSGSSRFRLIFFLCPTKSASFFPCFFFCYICRSISSPSNSVVLCLFTSFFPPSIPNPPLHSRVHLTKEEFITALSSLFPHDLMFRAAPVRGKIKMTN